MPTPTPFTRSTCNANAQVPAEARELMQLGNNLFLQAVGNKKP